ncbi:MAG: hypothetical protein WA864_07175 [Acetobacteraceae bacterium]
MRIEVIEQKLKPLLGRYFDGSLAAADLQRQVDATNRQNPLWGFGGIKGQMFFNLLMKTAEDSSEFDTQFRSAIRVPAGEEDAATRLRNFKSYVVRIGQQFLEAGGDVRKRPNPNSSAFFVSYFWQIQEREVWPVYYTNSVQVIEGMNLSEETGEIGQDYLTYKRLHETLRELFYKAAGRDFGLYDVEHVFWFKGKLSVGSPQVHVGRDGDRRAPVTRPSVKIITTRSAGEHPSLPESYVPPIVAIIPSLGRNEPEFREMAQRSGTTLDRAFEKCINAAFAVLGFEAQLLGQGKGRVPDGQAIAVDESYAILWDAKARADGYKMGTDDRAIRQYIDSQSRVLKRGRGLRNIYYVIISSSFADDFDDLIRSLKMETNINEVCLVETTALVSIVDQRLRAPLAVALGPDGIQRLFSASGIITADDVLEHLV